MRVGDYTASIVVDGKALEEYEVTLDSSSTAATCWVASEVGKVYALLSASARQVLTFFQEIYCEMEVSFGDTSHGQPRPSCP